MTATGLADQLTDEEIAQLADDRTPRADLDDAEAGAPTPSAEDVAAAASRRLADFLGEQAAILGSARFSSGTGVTTLLAEPLRPLQPLQRLTPARPAETATAATGVATLLAMLFGVRDDEAVAGMVAVVLATPAVVSWWVSNGGLFGLRDRFLRGGGEESAGA